MAVQYGPAALARLPRASVAVLVEMEPVPMATESVLVAVAPTPRATARKPEATALLPTCKELPPAPSERMALPQLTRLVVKGLSKEALVKKALVSAGFNSVELVMNLLPRVWALVVLT